MLVSQLPIVNYPQVHPSDKISVILQFMDDYDVQHLPVTDAEQQYAGVVSKDDLLDEDDTASLSSLALTYPKVFVQQQEHFLSALKIASVNDLSLLPVTNSDMQLMGIITTTELMHAAAIFQNVDEPGAILVLEMERHNYAFGELSRLVETNNASIRQLNTYTESSTGMLIVTIKLNKTEVSDILATLQRYDYTIRYFFGEEAYENELRENYDLLMTYLKI